MTDFFTFIQHLHSDIDSVILALNHSVYSEEHNFKEEQLIIHTGVRFRTQSGKQFDLFFDFSSKQLIRQVCNSHSEIPPMLGLVCRGTNKFINLFSEMVILKIYEGKDLMEIGELVSPKLQDDNYILVKDPETNETISERFFKLVTLDNQEILIPFSKEIPAPIFFDSRVFSPYISNEEYRNQQIHDKPPETYREFSGTYAQDEAGLSDEDIWTLFDGDASAYWNID